MQIEYAKRFGSKAGIPQGWGIKKEKRIAAKQMIKEASENEEPVAEWVEWHRLYEEGKITKGYY